MKAAEEEEEEGCLCAAEVVRHAGRQRSISKQKRVLEGLLRRLLRVRRAPPAMPTDTRRRTRMAAGEMRAPVYFMHCSLYTIV